MNINRNNYEEYFLLYADKELSAEEKNMVQMFVKQNPDLEEEFIMLQQSVLKPDDTIGLQDKSSLFRNEQFINQDNYEEKFLLYTDNELTLPEIEETEKFALSNSVLQNEFTLLQKIKYEADTSIIFPDKRSLYKKEDDAKVIPFRWKALAAAILLGAGLWAGISYLQKGKPVEVVTNDKTIQPKKHVVGNTVTEKKENSENLSVNINKKNENVPTKKQNIASEMKLVLNDPHTPELIIDTIIPDKPRPCPNFHVLGYTGANSEIGTDNWRSAQVYCTIVNTLHTMLSAFKEPVKKWSSTSNLIVNSRAGEDLNAYYDRSGLKFFYLTDPKTKHQIYFFTHLSGFNKFDSTST